MARAVRRGRGSSSDARKAPTFFLDLRDKVCPDPSADRYRPTLDDTTRQDNVVQTYAGDLRIGVGDVLSRKIRVFFKSINSSNIMVVQRTS